MPEPRLSVLIVAKNEAHNLADCLAAASWADERVVVVDPASRDATLEIARQEGGRCRRFATFDDFASQRNFALVAGFGRLGALGRRRRASDAGSGGRDPARDLPSRPTLPRVPRADPERDPGPAVRLFGDAARPAPAAVPPRFRPLGRPGS